MFIGVMFLLIILYVLVLCYLRSYATKFIYDPFINKDLSLLNISFYSLRACTGLFKPINKSKYKPVLTSLVRAYGTKLDELEQISVNKESENNLCFKDIYSNKREIYKKLKGKSGVYLFINNI